MENVLNAKHKVVECWAVSIATFAELSSLRLFQRILKLTVNCYQLRSYRFQHQFSCQLG